MISVSSVAELTAVGRRAPVSVDRLTLYVAQLAILYPYPSLTTTAVLEQHRQLR